MNNKQNNTPEQSDAEQRIVRLQAELDSLYNSGSWKITAPLRAVRRVVLSLGVGPTQWRFGLINFLKTSPSLAPLRRYKRALQNGNGSKEGGAITDSAQLGTVSKREFEQISKELKATSIEFSESASPLVSIIIPVFNQCDLTRQCLASLIRLNPQYSFEVIIIDDCSSDATQQQIGTIKGVKYIRNESNLGFTLSCNKAVEQARGQYFVFLNNDTVVRDKWLDTLVETFKDDIKTGLVGSKLIYPNGKLQEAGGLVWNDASAWNVGREGDPADPRYNYVREADYCSAASLMIRASLFRELGGFDEQFAPGYYEDTDLALQVRQKGLTVKYQPFSEVFHVEGGTAGMDVKQGMKASQVTNEAKFRAKWKDLLSDYGSPDSKVDLAQDKWCVGRALVVDVWPRPDRDSGSIDALNLFKNLMNMGYKVTFVPDNSQDHYGRYTRELQAIGVECLYSPYFNGLESYLEQNGSHLDVVFLRRVASASKHLEKVRKHCPQARVIFDTVDVHFIRERREAELTGSQTLLQQAAVTEATELALMEHSDATIVLSLAERELLEKQLTEKQIQTYVQWIPFSREIPGRIASYGQRKDIVFIGNYMHNPNVDAVKYFIQEIWPLIAEKLPEATFKFYGTELPQELLSLQSERVICAGYVEDLADMFEQARISVAPLRYGAGTKGKVVTSLSYGVPVVATGIAAEGILGENGQQILVADSPVDFANEVIKAYQDEDVWQGLSDYGIAMMRHVYSESHGLKHLQDMFENLRLVKEKPAQRNSHIEVNEVQQECIDEYSNDTSAGVRAIAFYLPQYHTIKENDDWWGKGFTEWTNVTKAKPLFEGHYQPHLPADLGFCDLRVPDVREAQAEMAKQYGLAGFCYYHYWFGGQRLLERPFNEVLASANPTLPFCLCWANENWTRRWDGRDREILMKQEYNDENDRAFIRDLFPAFEDDRYIRIDGKPLLMVYRTENLPNPKRSAEIWREECHKAGIGEIYLCRGETFEIQDPSKIGFDAAYEFPPLMTPTLDIPAEPFFGGKEQFEAAEFTGRIYNYEDMVNASKSKDNPSYKRFRGVSVSWDNAARIGSRAYMWMGSTPEKYGDWLQYQATQMVKSQPPSERLVFINAWNEWGEGCHLEPDQKYGRRYLEATQAALNAANKIRK